MPFYYKGAAPGTYWHKNDARFTGFTPVSPGTQGTLNRIIDHVRTGNIRSPFISLTRSYGVAESYAISGRTQIATPANPGYVYQIELDDPLPMGVMLMDPIKQVVLPAPSPPKDIPYHHDGAQTFLLGVVSPQLMNHFLSSSTPQPPGSTATNRTPTLSIELECIIRSLRDSEILAAGNIPSSAVVAKYNVY